MLNEKIEGFKRVLKDRRTWATILFGILLSALTKQAGYETWGFVGWMLAFLIVMWFMDFGPSGAEKDEQIRAQQRK